MREGAIQTETVSILESPGGMIHIAPRARHRRRAGDALENPTAIRRASGEEKRPHLIDTREMGTLAREAREAYSKGQAVSCLAPFA